MDAESGRTKKKMEDESQADHQKSTGPVFLRTSLTHFSFIDAKLPHDLSQNTPTDWNSLYSLLTTISPRLHKYSLNSLKQAITGLTLYIRKTQEKPEWNFYHTLLPHLVTWAENSEQRVEFPLLKSQEAGKMSLTSHQVRYLLANSFFLNTTSLSDLLKVRSLFGTISLEELYVVDDILSFQRLLCLLCYFARSVDLPLYYIHYERCVLAESEKPDWTPNNSQVLACDNVFLHTDSMEASTGLGFADFANEFIHIGHIAPSMTQEEVLFSCCPECFPSMLWFECMDPNEAVLIKGVKRFSSYTGYNVTFQWSGFYEAKDDMPEFRDVLVYDASMGRATQFAKTIIIRDLEKAYISFKSFAEGVEDPAKRRLSTGHWGCGAFGGDKPLKFLQQLCAATLTGISLDYSTFKDQECCGKLSEMLAALKEKNVTVGQAVELMNSFDKKGNFCSFVINKLAQ